MASRRHIPRAYEGRSLPGSGLTRSGPLPAGHRPIEPPPPPLNLGNRLAVQAAEIQQLAGDNHRLSATHVALRQDLVAAQREIKKLAAHLRSKQTESDIQIRVLMEKIAKMEVDIRAGESVKKDLQQAHIEARNLAVARQELAAQIKQATQKLEKARANVKRLPEMHAELDNLRQEHQKLRVTFEYEKGLNIEKVERMRIMEKDLMGMTGEVERLRAEVLNAEKRVHAPSPYGDPFIGPTTFYQPSMRGRSGYVDNYGRPPVQVAAGAMAHGMIPYGGNGIGIGAPGGAAGATAPGVGGNPAWRPAHAHDAPSC